MRLYQIRVDIYEAATKYAYPVVTHLFHGRTRAEAEGYLAAHLQADAFLRGCETRGVFGTGPNPVRCKTVQHAGWIS